MLKVITNPNEILRKKSQKVADISNKKIQDLIPEMIETMLIEDGVGLAAPQIGENIRMVVINHKDNTLVMINPKIIKKSFIKEWGEEGCLSVPNKYGEVKRHKRVVVKYQNEGSENKELKAHGLLARIVQHELDHLDGILFIDKARKLTDISY